MAQGNHLDADCNSFNSAAIIPHQQLSGMQG